MAHNKLLYTALILLQGCCAHTNTSTQSPPPIPPQAELKRVWMITEFPHIPRERLVQLQARLDLTQLPHATAHLGCHDFAFRVQMEQGAFRIHALAPTEPVCDHDTEWLAQFNQFIRHAQSYQVQGHFLTLTTSHGETVRFVAQDWD